MTYDSFLSGFATNLRARDEHLPFLGMSYKYRRYEETDEILTP